MVKTAVFSLALLGGLASAATVKTNAPLPMPPNSQIGVEYFPIACTYFGTPIVLKAFYSGTTPSTGAPGEPIYYTDVSMRVTIPKELTTIASQVGATYANSNVSVKLDLENATPAIYDLFPTGLIVNNVPLPSGKPVTVTVPGDNKVYPPIGPIKLGAKAGTNHVIYLRSLEIAVTLKNAKNKTILDGVQISCPKQKSAVQIGLINIDGPPSTEVLTPSNGYIPEYPTVALDAAYGAFRFPYDCDFGAGGKHEVDLQVEGLVKSSLKPSEKFYVSDVNAFLRVPTTVTKAFQSKYKGASQMMVSAQSFLVTATNASPKSVDALQGKGISSMVQFGSSGNFTIPLPATGKLQVGPFTAGTKEGSYSIIGIGSSTNEVMMMNSKGKTLATLTAKCAPKYQTNMIGFPITNHTVGEK